MPGEGIEAPDGVLQEDILITASAGGGEELVTGFVAQGSGIYIVAFGAAYPTFIREYRGNRFGGEQSFSLKACDSPRETSGERRSSPNSSAAALSSFLPGFLNASLNREAIPVRLSLWLTRPARRGF